MSRNRPRVTILVKLLVAFSVPTLTLFVGFAVLAYTVAERDLEEELGRRLSAVAASAATQIRGKYLVDLVPDDTDPDSERHGFYENARRKLVAVAEATGVARIYVFDRKFRSRVDTDAEVAIRSEYLQPGLDGVEVDRVFDRGELASGLLFEGNDGQQYKTGYAPVYEDLAAESAPVVLAIAVDAPATFFDRLASLRRSLILYGLLLILATGAVAVIVALRITRPVRSLVEAAERMGRGELEQPVRRTSRDEIGFLAETMDEMRADLRERDERMQMMLHGVAHEVRNPLGGMELFAGILRDELDGDDERQKHVARIEKEIGYLKRVVNDFLEYARRPKPELTEVDLAQMARDICDLEEGRASDNGVALECGGSEIIGRADGTQLRRVLLNLVRNAVEASADVDDDAKVRVSVTSEAGRATIAVFNSGPPIPEDVLSRVFEPFFTTREKGTGLGLAFAREIIADHGGTISVESNDDGTTFSVELPAG